MPTPTHSHFSEIRFARPLPLGFGRQDGGGLRSAIDSGHSAAVAEAKVVRRQRVAAWTIGAARRLYKLKL